MEVRESESVIEVKLEQPKNAAEPIDITESGISIEDKFEQPENAD